MPGFPFAARRTPEEAEAARHRIRQLVGHGTFQVQRYAWLEWGPAYLSDGREAWFGTLEAARDYVASVSAGRTRAEKPTWRLWPNR